MGRRCMLLASRRKGETRDFLRMGRRRRMGGQWCKWCKLGRRRWSNKCRTSCRTRKAKRKGSQTLCSNRLDRLLLVQTCNRQITCAINVRSGRQKTESNEVLLLDQ